MKKAESRTRPRIAAEKERVSKQQTLPTKQKGRQIHVETVRIDANGREQVALIAVDEATGKRLVERGSKQGMVGFLQRMDAHFSVPGFPTAIYTDMSPFFHSKLLADAARELHFVIHCCRPIPPHRKSPVERIATELLHVRPHARRRKP